MTPEQRYLHDINQQGFISDPKQLQIVQNMQSLYDCVSNSSTIPQNWFSQLFNKQCRTTKGLYLYGGVGRGKTYLIDLLYHSLPTDKKCRVHFHQFMQTIHQKLEQQAKVADPLVEIAKQIAADNSIIFLDEFHVLDITDAMILAGLLEALFKHQILLVTTSNSHPNDLYKNGLQRDRFLPAIDLINQNTHIMTLDGEIDYRRHLTQLNHCYPIHQESEIIMKNHFKSFVNRKTIYQNSSIEIQKRIILTKAVDQDCVWFDFKQICGTARSPGDYIELAQKFTTFFISNIPVLYETEDDEVQRFIRLIDILHDHHTLLFISAAGKPEELYRGKRLEFAFKRTASRLHEMSSFDYHQTKPKPRQR
ncbi:MAG: cell division protein ZapE [Methylococcales bacterium]|nr:cell division protein ZapE [Methylococcales bacterium]